MAVKTKIVSDFTANEVSLVRKAANRKKFCITKSEDTMDFEEILKTFKLTNEADVDAALSKIQKDAGENGIPDEAIALLKAASTLIGKAKGLMKEGDSISLGSSESGYVSVYKASDLILKAEAEKKTKDALDEAETKIKDAAKKEKEEEDAEKETKTKGKIAKALDLIEDAGIKGNVERIMKGEEPVDLTLPESAKVAIAKSETENQELRAKIQKMEDEKTHADLIAKAESFKSIPASAKDHAVSILKAVPEAAEHLFKAFDTAFTEAQALITKEVGSGAGDPHAGNSPFQVAINKALETDKTLTREQATAKVLTSNPEFYQS